MQATKPAQEDIVGAPGSDAPPPDERLYHCRVVEMLEHAELECPGGRCSRKLQDRNGLALAKAERLQRRARQPEDIARPRKGVKVAGRRARSRGQPAKQCHPRGDGELLAGDGVEETLEDGRETWRFDAAISLSELVQRAAA